MTAVTPPPPPAALVQPERHRLATEIGLGWPDLVAFDVRYRVDPHVGLGVSLALGAGPTGALVPLANYQAMPAVYLRYYLSPGSSSAFLQFAAGSQVAGLFNGAGPTAMPLMLTTYGYEWRFASGLTASVDGGADFNFNISGNASPTLRIGLRFGYAPP